MAARLRGHHLRGRANLEQSRALYALLGLIRALQEQGIAVAFSRVRDTVRDDMRRAEIEAAEIEAAVAEGNFLERTTDGVRAWQRQSSPAA